jgi:hypothetical protein
MTTQSEINALADGICRYLAWQKQREDLKEQKRLERQRKKETEATDEE